MTSRAFGEGGILLVSSFDCLSCTITCGVVRSRVAAHVRIRTAVSDQWSDLTPFYPGLTERDNRSSRGEVGEAANGGALEDVTPGGGTAYPTDPSRSVSPADAGGTVR